MIIIYTFKNDKGVICLDYGVDTKDDKFIVLPPEPLDCDKMGISYDIKGQFYYEK
mgnify:CR=1 FL=1